MLFRSLQKRVFCVLGNAIKNLFGRKKRISWRRGHFPRDYCAMYRRSAILKNNLTFTPLFDTGGGYSIAKQLWDCGYRTIMIPLPVLAERIVHVAHGTAAIVAEKPLHHRRSQKKVERKVAALFAEDWIKALRDDTSLDF